MNDIFSMVSVVGFFLDYNSVGSGPQSVQPSAILTVPFARPTVAEGVQNLSLVIQANIPVR